jgi:hypothetical protein
VHFLLLREKKKEKSVSYRRKEVTLVKNDMESGPSHPSNINTTCMTPESRALCAICGAPAIGKKTNFFESLFKLFSYVKGVILMHTLVYHVKVINRISLR